MSKSAYVTSRYNGMRTHTRLIIHSILALSRLLPRKNLRTSISVGELDTILSQIDQASLQLQTLRHDISVLKGYSTALSVSTAYCGDLHVVT